MKKLNLFAMICMICMSCTGQQKQGPAEDYFGQTRLVQAYKPAGIQKVRELPEVEHKIRDINMPEGYYHKYTDKYSLAFGGFKLKTIQNTNGHMVRDHYDRYVGDAAFVLDMSVHQYQDCAASAMQLHALAKRDTIYVHDNNKKAYPILPEMGKNLRSFSMCNSYSLEHRDTDPVDNLNDVMPGDMLIHGGFPGHVAVIMAVITNDDGDIKVMIGNGYLPAVEFHILSNSYEDFAYNQGDVWFDFTRIEKGQKDIKVISGASGWTFSPDELRRWKNR